MRSGESMDIVVGQILAGKYRVERVIGQGGMGIVVAATHLQLGERVAIKFLRPEVLQHAEAVEQFSCEARAAMKIKSEHVARVSDVGVLDTGSPYMVMDYMDGSDLAAWLLQRGPLTIEQAVQFLLQACEAIAEAHALGIVHRDLKPANLCAVQRSDGVLAIKVLDFGISKSTGFGGSKARLAKTSAAMGSPFYMSPEQMRSAKGVDPRSDIWALGAVLHELITGLPPFQAGSRAELVFKVVTARPTLLRDICPDAPIALEGVIIKCLEKDPDLRYPNVGALALALLEFAPRRSRASVERVSGSPQRHGMSGSALSPSTHPAERADAGPSGAFTPWGQPTPPCVNRRMTLLQVSALLAVPLLVVSGLAMRHALLGSPAKASDSAAQGSFATASAQPLVVTVAATWGGFPPSTPAPVAERTPVALPASASPTRAVAGRTVSTPRSNARGPKRSHAAPGDPDPTPLANVRAQRTPAAVNP